MNKEPQHFVIRILSLTKRRCLESKYTKIFTLLVILSTLLCIILEAVIVFSHIQVYQQLLVNKAIQDIPSNAVDPDKKIASNDPSAKLLLISLGLRRLKNENIFFILFSLFQLVLGFDAILRQNVIQLIAHTVDQVLLVVFAAIQVGGTIRKQLNVKEDIPPPENPQITWNFNFTLSHEIGLVSVMFIFSFLFIYICYKLYKQFDWNIYKRIGADIKLQARFRRAELYFLNLKLDAFFHFVLCVFYTVVMTQEKYYTLWGVADRKFIGYIIHIILTIILIPGLLLARHGILTENKKIIHVFLVTQFIMGLDFILILIDSAGSWVFWILAVCLAISLCISTLVLSIQVSKNFGKGLKPYSKRSRYDITQTKTHIKYSVSIIY
ncbi:uncharacterized protein BX663DRAFT_508170 [Cokeromyces recurvatus]|uniref:uncharacterized protein n=1 Tax=Cokeromyces recurvatus TaxID=90255 RepID=UPI00222009E0|nr:uncharacterized protein BX663DRAFT_508170 [Cokeromyces recurvatus]KAI7903305.1 hypothetical protein BX663DRAFT_508170 [Cokeromyces recurvatus]